MSGALFWASSVESVGLVTVSAAGIDPTATPAERWRRRSAMAAVVVGMSSARPFEPAVTPTMAPFLSVRNDAFAGALTILAARAVSVESMPVVVTIAA